MNTQQIETNSFRIKFVQNIAQQEEVAQRFGHFFRVDGDKAVVQPVVCHRFAGYTFGLCDFVFVMRED